MQLANAFAIATFSSVKIIFLMLLVVAGLCNSWHRDLAASIERRICFAGTKLQCTQCYNPADCGRNPRPHHWILWLLWSHHGKQVHAGDGEKHHFMSLFLIAFHMLYLKPRTLCPQNSWPRFTDIVLRFILRCVIRQKL